MPETSHQELSAASETLLMAVYIRAMESQRPEALIKDKKAVALVAQMRDEFARFAQVPMNDALKVMRNLATREYDRHARDFLARHPDAVVVHIGCGLDSRFERVDNGQVEWYDLDLPEVIELRRKLFGDEGERHHLLGCSVLEETWLEAVSAHRQRPFLTDILFTLGFAVMFRSIIGLALIPIWWVAFLLLVLVEETSLERALGQRYLEYKQQVKGRIIPRLPV
jgi:O-methyltransferase involved in polyketide biosynthesis